MQQLDDELLAYLGGAWDQPPVLEPGWEHDGGARVVPRSGGRDPRRHASARVRSGRRVFAWKDPRVSLLLPFWRTVTPIATTIVVVRDPVEVVASLGARGYRGRAGRRPRACGSATCSRQRRDDPGHLLVRHGDLFDDLPGTVARLAGHLGLPGARRRDGGGGARAPRHRPAAPRRERGAAGLEATRCSNSRPRCGTTGPSTSISCPPSSRICSARGWLRPPIDGELLARARADVVAARETLRKTNRRVAKLEAELAATRSGRAR